MQSWKHCISTSNKQPQPAKIHKWFAHRTNNWVTAASGATQCIIEHWNIKHTNRSLVVMEKSVYITSFSAVRGMVSRSLDAMNRQTQPSSCSRDFLVWTDVSTRSRRFTDNGNTSSSWCCSSQTWKSNTKTNCWVTKALPYTHTFAHKLHWTCIEATNQLVTWSSRHTVVVTRSTCHRWTCHRRVFFTESSRHKLCHPLLNNFYQFNIFSHICIPYLYAIFQIWSTHPKKHCTSCTVLTRCIRVRVWVKII